MSVTDRYVALALTVFGFAATLALTSPVARRAGHASTAGVATPAPQALPAAPPPPSAGAILGGEHGERREEAAASTLPIPVQVSFTPQSDMSRAIELVSVAAGPINLEVILASSRGRPAPPRRIPLFPGNRLALRGNAEAGDRITLRAQGYMDTVLGVP